MERNLISFTKFSKEILESGDIDPDYHFMREFSKFMKFDKGMLLNWIVTKSVVYRSVSELQTLIGGKTFKEVRYGNERNKHKNNALTFYMALTSFFQSFPPKKLAQLQNPLEALSSVNGVGPWARWKIVDLLDCVYGVEIDLSGVDFRKAYEFPLKGLLILDGDDENIQLLVNDGRYNVLMKEAWKQMPKVSKTPHNNNRGVRINELETCLCKYHSYVHGHYYPGKDLEHLKKDIAESDLKQLKKFKWTL